VCVCARGRVIAIQLLDLFANQRRTTHWPCGAVAQFLRRPTSPILWAVELPLPAVESRVGWCELVS